MGFEWGEAFVYLEWFWSSPNRYWLCAATGQFVKIWVSWISLPPPAPPLDSYNYLHLYLCSLADAFPNAYSCQLECADRSLTLSLPSYPLSLTTCHFYCPLISFISYTIQGRVQDLRKVDAEPNSRAKFLATPPKRWSRPSLSHSWKQLDHKEGCFRPSGNEKLPFRANSVSLSLVLARVHNRERGRVSYSSIAQCNSS